MKPDATPRPGGYRELWRVALPAVVSTGSFTVMQFTDRMFLSWHSAVSIQAALPAGILSFTMLCGFLALAGYTQTFVAQYHGAGDPAGCSRSTAQGVWLALLAWPVVWALLPAGRALLRAAGHPPAVQMEELAYFSILMLGSLPNLLAAALSGFFSGRGDTRTPMIAHLLANALNILLDGLLIFGRGGFPALGIRGAAWATVAAGLFTPLFLGARYFSARFQARYATRRAMRWDGPLLRRLLRFGLPAGAQLALDLTSFTFFVFVAGRGGALDLAASNIALSINTLAFMPMIGLSIAVSVVVGQHQGRRAPDIAARAGWCGLKMGGAYIALIGLSYVLFPSFYVGLFTDRGPNTLRLAEVLPTARILLILLAVWGTADAADLILAGALKGAGDTRFVMWYSLALAWGMLVGGLAVIVRVFDGGLLAVWSWATLYILVMAVGYLWRWRGGAWRDLDVLGRAEAPLLLPDRPGADALTVAD